MRFKLFLVSLFSIFLTACSTTFYVPAKTINKIDKSTGYRIQNTLNKTNDDENLVILMLSGGGSRAGALGYGVLEQFKDIKVLDRGIEKSLLESIDFVFGVSGGSVLASYFALEGKNVIPKFKEKFLETNFQGEIIDALFSLGNFPRLTSPQFGRGDLLQEQLNITLFKGRKFKDLELYRKGPFAVISATDMGAGQKINFTQEFFDSLCVDLSDIEIARAVAASSSVPLVFAPLTFNNNGGKCNFNNKTIIESDELDVGAQQEKNLNDIKKFLSYYSDSENRPYLHLVDGGLTDNLGLATLTDMYDTVGSDGLYQKIKDKRIKNIVIICVNAQNEVTSDIDSSANIPPSSEVLNAIINVPIDRNTQTTLRRFREFTDNWNKTMQTKQEDERIKMHFVDLELKDLPDSYLKKDVLNISTSFYLPKRDVEKLLRAAKLLVENSEEFKDAVNDLKQ